MRAITSTIHLVARSFADVTGWSTIATLIKRAQIHDKRDCNTWKWVDYPANRFGWITTNGRFVGVGVQPKHKLQDDELLVRIELPFEGSGVTLSELCAKKITQAYRKAKARQQKAAA